MLFKDLTERDLDIIRREYELSNNKKGKSRNKIQKDLSNFFGVHPRTIRKWAKKMGLGVMTKNIINPSKILVYDIETSRATAKVFWTGKQYVSYKQIIQEPQIITIAWKWLGSENVNHATWDIDNHSDKQMVETFLKDYNKASMVIGFNNDNFDNRWVNARAMKYNLDVNTFVRSLDIYKQEKRLFRLLSYSMDYSSLYSKVERKQSNDGMLMWDMIEMGTLEQQKEYLSKMLDYNIGDIITTEELYLRLRPYLKHVSHLGVSVGLEKWSCPDTGSTNVDLYNTTWTPSGTIQRVMVSKETGTKYKISNKEYMSFLDYVIKNK